MIDFVTRRAAVNEHRSPDQFRGVLGNEWRATPFGWTIATAEWEYEGFKAILLARPMPHPTEAANFVDIYLTYNLG